MRRQALDDTRDRITDILGGRDQQRAREQQHRREVVVHPEHHRVGGDLLTFQVFT